MTRRSMSLLVSWRGHMVLALGYPSVSEVWGRVLEISSARKSSWRKPWQGLALTGSKDGSGRSFNASSNGEMESD